ncbi:hypothetical protein EIP86_007721 [Pleurotus ostreatoroseus]|nr:hypothetical protein EIP86_007721 [Pleurotus ostreatoroseus]
MLEVVVEIAYGHEVKSANDDYVQLAEKSNDILADLGDTSLIDLFPALKHLPAWFPGAWPVVQRMKDQPFEYVQQEIAAGTARTSFLTIQLEEMRRSGDESEDGIEALKVAAMHMYAATMLIHPLAQKKAQQEIDRVIGVSRLPDFSDRELLPYVECVIQESARWHLTAPLGE